jgi:hypothetical protein
MTGRRVPGDPAVDGAPLPGGAGRHAADAFLGRARAVLPHGQSLPRRLLLPRRGRPRAERLLPLASSSSSRRRQGLQLQRLGVGGGHGSPPSAEPLAHSGRRRCVVRNG